MNRKIIADLLSKKKTLEIGPFLRPLIKSENVKYLDVLSVDDLKKRAEKVNYHYDEQTAPREIHYVIKNEDWSIIKEKFDAAFSSHCIEHQENFIRHLRNVSNILNSGGSYYLCIPDKRYIFDHYKPITTFGELVDEYTDSGLSFRKYFNMMLSVHNDCQQHWEGLHGDRKLTSQDIKDSLKKWGNLKDEYVDFHRRYFTPKSFYINMILLYKLGYTDLFPVVVTETQHGTSEFYAQLLKNDKIETDIEFSVSEYFSDMI